MPATLWLSRPKPQDDELLSSWLVHIAWSNVEKIESWSSKLWGTRSQIWTQDIDRLAPPQVYELIAEKCGVDLERAWQTTLASYEGILYERHHSKGAARWLMPTGGRKRGRFLYGLQCCPICLREDAEPYYRRKWRLAFVTVCLKHKVLLIDRCDQCGSPISFHQSDFGSFDFPEVLRMTHCKKCGKDYRNIQVRSIYDLNWGSLVTKFQTMAELAIEDHWAVINARTKISVVMFFEGIHHLVRALASNSHCNELKKVVLQKFNLPILTTNFEHGLYTERLAVDERFNLFGMIGWLLQTWPNNFIECAKEAKLSSSYFKSYREPLPYWISMPIKWYLDRTWYVPNKLEIQAVRCYLDRNRLPVSRNNVSKWLGRWYVTRLKKENLISLDSQFPIPEKENIAR